MRRNSREIRSQPCRIVNRAHENEPRALVNGTVEVLPENFHKFDAASSQMRREIKIVWKLVLQGNYAITRTPVDAGHHDPKRGRCVRNECNIRSVAVNELPDGLANA